MSLGDSVRLERISDFFKKIFRRRNETMNEFEMTERMWGYVSKDVQSFKDGYKQGKKNGNRLEYNVTLKVKNFQEFTAPSGRRAPMSGTVSCKNLFGEDINIY